MADTPGVRVSDEDRERTAREIRDHFAAGRLSDDELSERLTAVYRARTEDQLVALRSDLPKLPVTARAELAERRAILQRQLLQQTGGGLSLFLICTVVWAASGGNGMFWPIWVALVAVIPLIRNGWRLYGPAPELERVEQELAGRRQHAGRRADRDARRAARRGRR
jgi:hypothetical protein